MSELRDRMIRDMAVRGLARRTHETYIAAVVRLAKYYRRSPDQLTNDEVQAYLAHLILERKLSWSTCRQAANAFPVGGDGDIMRVGAAIDARGIRVQALQE